MVSGESLFGFRMKFSVVPAIIASIIISSSSHAQHVTTYTYDALGQLTEIDGPSGADRRYVYDDSGNRIIARSAPNTAPVVQDDIIGISDNDPTQIFDLLANDSDANNHPIVITRIFNVQHDEGGQPATVSLRSDGLVNITPGAIGFTTFSYEVSDFESTTVGTGTVWVIGTPGCQFFC